MRIFLVLGVMSLLAACGEAEQASETVQTPKSTAPAGNIQEASVSEVNVLSPEAAELQFQSGSYCWSVSRVYLVDRDRPAPASPR